MWTTLGGRARKLFASGRFSFVRISLFSAALELGRTSSGNSFLRCFFESSLWLGSRDGGYGNGSVGLSADLDLGKSFSAASLLESLVGRLLRGDPCILRGDEYGSVVDDSDLREKLVWLGSSIDDGNPGLRTHVDFFEELTDFRSAFHRSLCGGGGMVGQEVGWKSSFGLDSCPGSLTCPRICGSR